MRVKMIVFLHYRISTDYTHDYTDSFNNSSHRLCSCSLMINCKLLIFAVDAVITDIILERK